MWEDYVSFETAKLLKEKGFVLDNITMLIGNDNKPFLSGNSGYEYLLNLNCEVYPAPTLQMAMKWLREKCNIFISIVFCTYPTEKRVTWTPEISTFDSVFPESAIEYDSYEEACEAGIKYCLTNLI